MLGLQARLNQGSDLQLGPLYIAVMDAVHAIPNATATLFFVEGTGQLGLPGINWGDGFVTDQTIISQYGLSDPNSFFQTILTKPYLNQVGVAPHVYPPSVTYASTVCLCRCQPSHIWSDSKLCLPKSLDLCGVALDRTMIYFRLIVPDHTFVFA